MQPWACDMGTQQPGHSGVQGGKVSPLPQIFSASDGCGACRGSLDRGEVKPPPRP